MVAIIDDLSKLNPQRRAGVAMLRTLPQNSVCAEIGVYRGAFSRIIMDVVNPKSLYLIDPWQWKKQWYVKHSVEELESMRTGENTPEGDSLYEAVAKLFRNKPEVKILRAPSVEASAQFQNAHFDWIFIDGDHRYEPCRDDIRHWWPKLKLGGFICGDDYLRAEAPRRQDKFMVNNGVHFAVDEFVLENKLKIELFPWEGDGRANYSVQKPR